RVEDDPALRPAALRRDGERGADRGVDQGAGRGGSDQAEAPGAAGEIAPMDRRRFAQAVAALALAGCERDKPHPGEVTLAAAASLRFVLPVLSRAFEAGNAVPGVDPPPPMARPTTRVVATYGASGDLKKQV